MNGSINYKKKKFPKTGPGGHIIQAYVYPCHIPYSGQKGEEADCFQIHFHTVSHKLLISTLKIQQTTGIAFQETGGLS